MTPRRPRKQYWNEPTLGLWEKLYIFEIVRGLLLDPKLILIDELPRNAVGKILKRELRARFFPKSAVLAGAQA